MAGTEAAGGKSRMTRPSTKAAMNDSPAAATAAIGSEVTSKAAWKKASRTALEAICWAIISIATKAASQVTVLTDSERGGALRINEGAECYGVARGSGTIATAKAAALVAAPLLD